jgi:hypothetical protein
MLHSRIDVRWTKDRSMNDHRPKWWFALKRHGYGASLPIAWQGWSVLALFLVALLAVRAELTGTVRVIAVLVLVALLVTTCALKTEGGWHWRWNRKLCDRTP